jgi:LCP family protein required for cell wall assembly
VGIVVGVLVLIALAIVIGSWAWWGNEVNAFKNKNAAVNAKVAPLLVQQRQPGKPFYMVLMGTDMRSTEQVGNSDTLMVAYVDPPRKHVTLISIPRDTRVDIPGHGVHKINAAALLGGPALTIATVKNLTGLPISHYVVVDFWGFKEIVDAIGGVWINVPTRINDIAAANHDPSAAVIPAGYQKLDGKHALTFVRARHQFATQDLQRVKDQQAFLKALAKQTLQLSNLPRAPQIIHAVLHNVTTDMSVDDLWGLEADFRGLDSKSVETATAPGTPQYIGGVSYVIFDQAAFARMVQRIEAGEPLQVQPPAKKPSAPTAPAKARSSTKRATTR